MSTYIRNESNIDNQAFYWIDEQAHHSGCPFIRSGSSAMSLDSRQLATLAQQ